MKEYTLQIDTNNFELCKELERTKPAGVSIARIVPLQKTSGLEEILYGISIGFTATVAAELFCNWLKNKLEKHSSGKVTINRKEIFITDGEIRKIVEETITIQDKGSKH
jgi:hypothetical protein